MHDGSPRKPPVKRIRRTTGPTYGHELHASNPNSSQRPASGRWSRTEMSRESVPALPRRRPHRCCHRGHHRARDVPPRRVNHAAELTGELSRPLDSTPARRRALVAPTPSRRRLASVRSSTPRNGCVSPWPGSSQRGLAAAPWLPCLPVVNISVAVGLSYNHPRDHLPLVRPGMNVMASTIPRNGYH